MSFLQRKGTDVPHYGSVPETIAAFLQFARERGAVLADRGPGGHGRRVTDARTARLAEEFVTARRREVVADQAWSLPLVCPYCPDGGQLSPEDRAELNGDEYTEIVCYGCRATFSTYGSTTQDPRKDPR